MRRRARVLTLAPLLALLAIGLTAAPGLTATAAAAAPQPKVAINEIEAEVMCPVCGTLLELAESPQAQREKVFVARLIADGQEQGPDQGRAGRRSTATRCSPCRRAPASTSPPTWCRSIAFVIAVDRARLRGRALAPRRRGAGARAAAPPTAPEGEEAERLDADLARYDL